MLRSWEKINKLDEQHEVETICGKLFDDAEDQDKKIAVENERAKYRESIAEIEKHLASAEESNKKLSKQVLDNAIKLDEKKEEVKAAELKKNNYKKNLETTSEELKKTKSVRDGYQEHLKDMEAKWKASEERLETAMKELEEVKTEREASEERFAAVSKQLAGCARPIHDSDA